MKSIKLKIILALWGLLMGCAAAAHMYLMPEKTGTLDFVLLIVAVILLILAKTIKT